ncbi:hypothetical protein [Dactylosporangium sp. CA-092794]|uniref:hypothetical protein n=1 Tax=Dactylosporangium sp. CA-092794 TaxID=3239929 RepID=UPI003D8F755D
MTADALHCQRDHFTYLAERGARWILTAKGNQPSVRQRSAQLYSLAADSLHQQLASPSWRFVPVADRTTDRCHGRQEIDTLKILSRPAIDFPGAALALQIRRRRRRLDKPRRFTTEIVYAITDLQTHQAKTVAAGRLNPQPLVDREQGPLGSRRHLRRRPLPGPNRHRTSSHGRPAQRRHRRPTP